MRLLQISDKGAVREPDYPNWNGYVEAYFSAAWGGFGRAAGAAQEVAAPRGVGIFCQAAANGYRNGGVRGGALLGAGVAQARPRGEADGAATREGLRQAQQERRARCRGIVRGDEPADDAVRAGEDRGAAGGADADGSSPAADRKAHPAQQRDPRLRGGVRPDRGQGSGQDRAVIGADRASRELAGAGARDICDRGSGIRAVASQVEGDRSQADGLAPLQRRQPAAGADSRGGTDRRHDTGDEGARSRRVSFRPAFRSLARADPEGPFHRRQDPARQDHPRRVLPAVEWS